MSNSVFWENIINLSSAEFDHSMVNAKKKSILSKIQIQSFMLITGDIEF